MPVKNATLKRKRNIKIILVALIAIVLVGGYAVFVLNDNDQTSDIQDYGQWNLSDIKGKLDIFPKSMEEETQTEYFYSYKSGILDGTYQIYLKRQLSSLQYEHEIERLQGITDTYEGQVHAITFDKNNYMYPAYVSIYNFDSTYAYALCDEENYIIYYIYLQFIPQNKIQFDNELLPKGYLTDENKYNMYAYKIENDGWYYQTK